MICGQSFPVFLLLVLTEMTTVKIVDGLSQDTNETSAAGTCRDRTNYLSVESFRLTTCANCYLYLFMDDASKYFYPEDEWLVHPNTSRILADIHSEQSRTEICATLKAEECQRWESCCREAEKCCGRQRERSVGVEGRPLCPQTWDGFGCWDYTLPGRVASGSCPEYIQYADPSGFAAPAVQETVSKFQKSYKTCTVNGSWYLHPETNLEWTDYSSCISLEMTTAKIVIMNPIAKIVEGLSQDTNETYEAGTCRDRTNHLSVESFRLTTCANCYLYLFMDDASKYFYPEDEWLVHLNTSRILADIHSEQSRTEICATLKAEECQRWESCCREAEKCCSRQKERAVGVEGRPTTYAGKPLCPQTWDGFGCWDYTLPGRVASGSCPEYIQYADPSEKSYKTCTVNGTWYLHPDSNLEWTDYSSCISLENLKRSTITSIVCNVISLVALIPSVTIFLYYRPLRCQNRIRLHVNLFMSFILYGIVTLLWDVAIVLDRIEHTSNMTTMNQNSGGCKVLYVLTRYSRMANFLWMFCEAVYLHRLLVKAFEPPKNLVFFYCAGWVFPWFPIAAYTILRFLFANTSCWIKPFGYWEWLLYVPNLLALLMNLIVLLDILRILITQVQSLQNELNSNRRALKAMFILVPLFGLQLFLVIYRPPYQSAIGRHYEMIAAFVVNLQGLFVSLIYCLANGEVMSHLNRSWQKLTAKIHRQEFHRTSSFSNTTHSELFSLTSHGSRRNSASTTASTNHKRSSKKTTALNGRSSGVTDSDVNPVRNDDVARQPDCVILVADLAAIEEVDEAQN